MSGRDFSVFDFNFPLVVSASQLDRYRDCPRGWAFEKVIRLPLLPFAAGPFGNTTHDAIERYLKADARGRDSSGRPVEVYPEGWDHEVSATEASLIQILIAKAIEEGIIKRVYGSSIEGYFQRDVVPREISIIGFGDVMEPTAYEDHKTTKSFLYCETSDSLAENVQMIVGAAEVLTRAIERGINTDSIRIAHNYFLKDVQKPMVKKVENDLTTGYIQDFWFDGVENEAGIFIPGIVPTAEKMLELKRNTPDWGDIDGPKTKGICKKYSGCPFKNICGGSETVDQYKERMAITLAITKKLNQPKTTRKETNEMSIFDDLRAQRKAAAGTSNSDDLGITDEQIVTPTTEVSPEEEATEETDGPITFDRAPWATDECVACAGNAVPGYNSQGSACRACTRRSDVKTTDFRSNVILNDDGTARLQLVRKKDGQVFLLPAVGKATTKPTNTAKPPVVTKETPPAEARAAIQTGEKKKVGRPKEGFTLIYGTVKRGKRDTVDLNLVLMQQGQELATAQGAESYYQLDFGKRRDYLAIKAKAIAETFGAADVVVSNIQDADVRAFAAAIEPYAMRVIVAGV